MMAADTITRGTIGGPLVQDLRSKTVTLPQKWRQYLSRKAGPAWKQLAPCVNSV